MHRHIPVRLFALLLLPLLMVPAGANSAPVYWEGAPASEVLAVEENCPITVSAETLTFAADSGLSGPYSLGARVTATYQMENPTGEDRAVQMAFPVWERPAAFDPQSVSVTADGQAVPFRLRFGERIYRDFIPTQFDPHAVGTLYTLTPVPGGEDERVALSFRPAEGQKVFVEEGDGGGYGWTDGVFTLELRSWAGDTARIFAFGPPLSIEVTQGAVEREEAPAVFADYFDGYLAALPYACQYAPVFTGDLRTFQYLGLNQIWTDAACAVSGELDQYGNLRQPIMLVYAVDFPAGESREVAVAYRTAAEGDRRTSADWTHTFTYLLQPARHWASFGTLDIAIQTAPEAPYLIASSVPMEEDGPGRYAVRLDGLPVEDLTFTLYTQPSITLLDRASVALRSAGPVLLFAMPLGLVLIVCAVCLIRRTRRG